MQTIAHSIKCVVLWFLLMLIYQRPFSHLSDKWWTLEINTLKRSIMNLVTASLTDRPSVAGSRYLYHMTWTNGKVSKEQVNVVVHYQQNAEGQRQSLVHCWHVQSEYTLTPADSTKRIIVKDKAVLADNKLGCAKYNIGQRHLSQSKWDEATEPV